MIWDWENWTLGAKLLASARLASSLGFAVAMLLVTGRVAQFQTRSAQDYAVALARKNVARQVGEAASDSIRTASATQELASTVHEVARTALGLSDVADRLSAAGSRFKG